MNKDVIYIEPEDDITDIIAKVENSKEKIIALVPPKKAGVFHSIVNVKLVVKAGVNAGKTIVLVTADPSIIKLAATAKLPVTKDLKSAPAIPKAEDSVEIETASADEVLEADGGQTEESVVEDIEAGVEIENDEDEESEEEDDSKAKKSSKSKDEKDTGEKKKKRKLSDKQRKIVIGAAIGGAVVFILLLVWAFVIAPSVSVTVAIRTTATNFSENANFTTKLAEENVAEGKFYLDEKKKETKIETSFEATGNKNIGEKAKGEVIVYTYFREKGNVAISEGATFSNSGLSFVADKGVTLSWDGVDTDKCENSGEPSSFTSGCLILGRVEVTATGPGTEYNLSASSSGWSTTANVGVYSDQSMSGGTSKNIIVVQQSDIDAALAKIADENAASQASRKTALLSTIEEGSFIIDSSFKQSVSDPVSTPAIGEEVKSGEKATLSVTTTDSIYIVDKTKVEEFITEKAKLTDDYKIYEMNDPFIENFTGTGDSYIGKIKTSFVSGPKVTENEILDTIRGKGLGEARAALLDSFNGIDSNNTKIEPSYPWVFSVPNDNTKITVTIEVEDK